MTEKTALYATSFRELQDETEHRPAEPHPEKGYTLEKRALPYRDISRRFENYKPRKGRLVRLGVTTLRRESAEVEELVLALVKGLLSSSSWWEEISDISLMELIGDLLKPYRESYWLLSGENPYLVPEIRVTPPKEKSPARLRRILSKEGMLTLDDLKFIVSEVLPRIGDLPDRDVEELERKLRADAERKLDEYGKWLDEHGFVWASIYDPEELLREENLSKLTPAERVKELLKAEMIMERSKDVATLTLEVFTGKKKINDALKILFKKDYCLERLGLL